MTPQELLISQQLADLRRRNANVRLPAGFIPKVSLMRHQKLAFYYGVRLANSALLLEQGLGKTAIAINAMRYRIEKGQVRRILVVSPKNVMYSWEKEITKHSNLGSVILHDSSWKVRRQRFRDEAEFYIINYDGVSIFYDEIRELDPDALILDESTRIKNIQANRTKTILNLSKDVPYKMLLTGTPLTNSPMDIFCQMYALDPTIFGKTNFWQWRASYFKDVGIYYPKWVPRHGSLDNIQKQIYTISVRYTKVECLDLPSKVYQTLYVDLTPTQLEIYNKIQKRLVVSLGEKKVNTPYVMTQLMKLTQIESGWIKSDIVRDEEGKIEEEGEIFDLGPSPKIEVLSELFDDLLYDNKKVIVWARFVHSIKLIENLCKKKKIGYITYYGSTKDVDRKVAESNFQTVPSIKVFIANKAGAFGTTLTAADTAIYYELDDDVEVYEQSQDRNHRIGSEQHSSITYIHLLVKDGVGEKTLESLREKKKLSSLVVERRNF